MKKLILGASVLMACSSSPITADPSGGAGSGAGGGGGGPEFDNTCSAARAQLLGSIETVSSGEVTVLGEAAGVTTLYVNATAGGTANAPMNPWTFISLGNAARVEVNDVTSLGSTAWDLALKRALIYTNDGDGGPGTGGAVMLEKDFADVTSADAASADFGTETFFDAECTPSIDITGAVYTSFASWYSYDDATHVLTPVPETTWLVRGGTGKIYKLRFQSYYSTPTGGTSMAGGGYLVDFEAL